VPPNTGRIDLAIQQKGGFVNQFMLQTGVMQSLCGAIASYQIIVQNI